MGTIEDQDVVTLRDVTVDDLPLFFQHQLDPEAVWMAAFGVAGVRDWDEFAAHWARSLSDNTRVAKAVLWNGQVAGNVSSFVLFGDPAVGYWIGREYWGKGIATRALAAFLEVVTVRPIYARAAMDNIGSRRVLEKCGFVVIGEDVGYARARGAEIDEVVLRLD
ncbi:MAG TPA: GNAT family N-acetyltransferase [Anaerolineae bacterium]|nr:GNAT family N-acetyltransferase [Anaerolineae bacterium]HNU05761.1 GNAT family N-acetyltransferase [Anaerolineae bacterium]